MVFLWHRKHLRLLPDMMSLAQSLGDMEPVGFDKDSKVQPQIEEMTASCYASTCLNFGIFCSWHLLIPTFSSRGKHQHHQQYAVPRESEYSYFLHTCT